MRNLYYIILILFLSGCMIHKEKLTFYNNTYFPNSECIKTNGFYVNSKNNLFHNNDLQPFYFYDDGSIYTGSTFSSYEDINQDASNYKRTSYDLWGFYKCDGDSIISETVRVYADEFRAKIISFNGSVNEGNTILYFDNDTLNLWIFVESNYKPDSTNNWVKTHKKYKIIEE